MVWISIQISHLGSTSQQLSTNYNNSLPLNSLCLILISRVSHLYHLTMGEVDRPRIIQIRNTVMDRAHKMVIHCRTILRILMSRRIRHIPLVKITSAYLQVLCKAITWDNLQLWIWMVIWIITNSSSNRTSHSCNSNSNRYKIHNHLQVLSNFKLQLLSPSPTQQIR